MPRAYKDSTLKLGEPIASKISDFLAANYNGDFNDLVREAVNEHIDRRLEEPAMKERFERERRNREGEEGSG
jgi:hypothetical protein